MISSLLFLLPLLLSHTSFVFHIIEFIFSVIYIMVSYFASHLEFLQDYLKAKLLKLVI